MVFPVTNILGTGVFHLDVLVGANARISINAVTGIQTTRILFVALAADSKVGFHGPTTCSTD